jgi:TetR/AcrR family transcriptional repressor of bet genes
VPTSQTPTTIEQPEKKRRQVRPRSERRQQLIDATIRCIAAHGLSATTMQLVTREAGLSLGIANLHFRSKENLLTETLRHVTREYNEGLLGILANDSPPSLAATLRQLLDFQLSRGVTQRQKMAVWFAYYGEAGARPVYQTICSASDRLAARKTEALFEAIISDGQYRDRDARQLATGYLALIDGLWLSLLVAPRDLNKARAKAVARAYLQQAFPKHIA